MEKEINVAVIYGSIRQGRLCDTVAKWVLSQISRERIFRIDVIDPREYARTGTETSTLGEDPVPLRTRIERADAFIVITPEYNRGYPAALKELIDAAYCEWNAKPVAFVSYGGMSGGIRAVEQLRQVFAELHVVTLRDGVSFANVWDQFAADGSLRTPERAEKAFRAMTAQLAWWADALRQARSTRSYQEILA